MAYYFDSRFARVKEAVDAEVREGGRSLRASYLARKYQLDPALVQQVLGDLVGAGDLKARYTILCSGQQQRYDPDGEFSAKEQIPNYEISCRRCGDRYVPSEENVVVSFEPTESYVEDLVQHS